MPPVTVAMIQSHTFNHAANASMDQWYAPERSSLAGELLRYVPDVLAWSTAAVRERGARATYVGRSDVDRVLVVAASHYQLADEHQASCRRW